MRTFFLMGQRLFGIILIIFGLNHIFKFFPIPEYHGTAKEFIQILNTIGYLMPLVITIQILSGLAFVFNFFVAFGTMILLPVTVNIFLFHFFLDRRAIGLASCILMANIGLIGLHFNVYKQLLKSKRPFYPKNAVSTGASSLKARWLITFCAILTIFVPSLMDLNSTHMTNPLWPPHARFHWAIQWFSITFLNMISLYLLWGNYREKNTQLSVIMAGIGPLLFWCSFFPSMLMPGVSTWPDGIDPFAPIAPNVLVAVFVSLICLIAIWLDLRSRKICTYAR